MHAEGPISYWHDSLVPGDDLSPRPALPGDRDVDVAIVGAGFTGLWTAHSLLRADPAHAMVVGDSIWDLLAARRAGSLGIGLLSGGYGRDELERAGAFRVYADPADMLARLDELGVRHGD